MSSLVILSAKGDDRLDWNVNDPASVTKARSKFQELKKAGYLLFKLVSRVAGKIADALAEPADNLRCKQGEVLHEFEPEAEVIVASPPLVGG